MAGGHMNKQRRNAIDKLKCKLEDIFNELEAIAEEEREAFDSMPEGLQSSERGQKSDEAAGGLENAACELQAVIDALDDVTS